ncbi:MAG: hypothetical protein MHM6MM_001580 [Cercozoa sp. M6MM]
MSSGQEAAFATLVLMPSMLLVLFTGVRLFMVRFAATQWLSLEKRSRRQLAWLKRVVLGDDSSAKRLSDDPTRRDETEFDFAADAMSPQELCERNFRDMLHAGASRRVALRRTLDSQVKRGGGTFREHLARCDDHEDPAESERPVSSLDSGSESDASSEALGTMGVLELPTLHHES